mgnify:CR=1 FL=1
MTLCAGFTAWLSDPNVTAERAMVMLDRIFTKLDAICDEFGMYKVRTIGDCYMSCAGAVQPEHRPEVNLLRATLFAWNCIQVGTMQSVRTYLFEWNLSLRMGVFRIYGRFSRIYLRRECPTHLVFVSDYPRER